MRLLKHSRTKYWIYLRDKLYKVACNRCKAWRTALRCEMIRFFQHLISHRIIMYQPCQLRLVNSSITQHQVWSNLWFLIKDTEGTFSSQINRLKKSIYKRQLTFWLTREPLTHQQRRSKSQKLHGSIWDTPWIWVRWNQTIKAILMLPRKDKLA